MLAIVLVLSALILALLGIVLWLSIRSGGPGDTSAAYTLANYANVFGDPFTYRVLLNTLLFSAVTLLVSFIFGLPTAWLVERTDIRAKPLIYTFMTLGLLLPGFATAMGWLFLMHPRIGLANTFFTSVLGFASGPFDIASIFGMGWVQGLNLAARLLHHDGGGVPRHGPVARGIGRDVRRQLRRDRAAHHRQARLARHPRRRHLRVHHRLRSLRRAGDHRLVEPHLHLLDLSGGAAQRRRRPAALRRDGGAVGLRDRLRRRSCRGGTAGCRPRRTATRWSPARATARAS